MRKLRLGIFVTHPVQYHVPLWRRLAEHPELHVQVRYFSRQGLENRFDSGFGREIQWDNDLLGGYQSQFLSDIRGERLERAVLSRNQLTELAEFDVALLHGYTHRFAQQILQRKRVSGLRVVMRAEFSDRAVKPRNLFKNIARDWFLRRVYSKVDTFCYIGADAKDHLHRRGIQDKQLFFSPYCVDGVLLTTQAAQTPKLEVRKSLGISPDEFIFLFSGKLIERKQPMMLLEAFRTLAEKHKATLLMVGDGPLMKQLRNQGASLLAKRQLFLPGFVNQTDLGRYIAASDVFVLPSKHDTWGLVVNEAMSFGLPCIVSDHVGCHRDLITPGDTGEVFPASSADRLTEVMSRFLNGHFRADQMKSAVLERIEKYSIRNAANGICNALKAASNGIV